jgi:predicted glutamine amidotransferase
MCRLFGMHAGARAVPATFWLIDAPDSLSEQSHRNPDGAGIGAFGVGGELTLSRQPIAAWTDTEFATAAHQLRGTTFVAHVRYASTGGLTVANTHPFQQAGRLFAHNGVVLGLADLDARIGALDATDLVRGQTDSERVFALITAETARCDGDVTAGLTAAIGWVIDNLPLYALNLVVSSATDLWALRYPATHELYVLDRPAGGTGTHRDLDVRSHRIRARSEELAGSPAVIVATEQMDDDPGWRLLRAGELLHVRADLSIESSTPFPAPRRQLTVAELDATAAASQHPTAAGASMAGRNARRTLSE